MKSAGYGPLLGVACAALIGLGSHGHLFSSALQFKAWYELLVGRVEEVVKHEVMKLKEPATQMIAVFEVEAKALHDVQTQGIYSSDPQVKQLQHISVTECVLSFWWKELRASEMLGCVH